MEGGGRGKRAGTFHNRLRRKKKKKKKKKKKNKKNKKNTERKKERKRKKEKRRIGAVTNSQDRVRQIAKRKFPAIRPDFGN